MRRIALWLTTALSAYLMVLVAVATLRLMQEAGMACLDGADCGADSFARDYFEGFVPFDKVLASNQDLPDDALIDSSRHKDCSFAIVQLAPDAPERPPAPRFDLRGKAYRWGMLTRVSRTDATRRTSRFDEAMTGCAQFWSKRTQRAVQLALDDPLTYRSDGPSTELFYLYSAPHRVAMRLRYRR